MHAKIKADKQTKNTCDPGLMVPDVPLCLLPSGPGLGQFWHRGVLADGSPSKEAIAAPGERAWGHEGSPRWEILYYTLTRDRSATLEGYQCCWKFGVFKIIFWALV